MFKIGCSVAKKILPTHKSSSSSSNSSSTSNNNADNQQQAANNQRQPTANNAVDDINDFSKIKQDPRMPLNVRQMFKITKSWKAIARTMSKTGTAMFLNLFEQNDDLFYLFERFKHLRGSKNLHESIELREHAATVMSTLDQSINAMSDFDNFVAHLHSIGKLHEKVPGFKREYFWRIEQPFLKAVKQTLDERCNETIEQIYQIAIKLIIATIADGYDEKNNISYNNNEMNENELKVTDTVVSLANNSNSSTSNCQDNSKQVACETTIRQQQQQQQKQCPSLSSSSCLRRKQ